MDGLKNLFLTAISAIFGIVPKINDLFVSLAPAGYEKTFNLLFIVLVVCLIVYVIRALASKIIIIGIILLLFPGIVVGLGQLIPGLDSVVAPVEKILSGSANE